MGFLRQVAGMTARNLRVNTWQNKGAEKGAPGDRDKASLGIHQEEAGNGSEAGSPATNI